MESFKFSIKYRPLFFNKYPYRATFDILGARFLPYSTSIKDYRIAVDRARALWDSVDRWAGYNYDLFKPAIKNKRYIDDVNYTLLENYIKWKDTVKENCAIRRQGDRISVFAEEAESIEQILDFCPLAEVTKAVFIEHQTKYFKKEPKFKYRIYIKTKKFTGDFYSTMVDFLEKNANNVTFKVSPALNRFFRGARSRTVSRMLGSYYIDYVEPSQEIYLHILFSGMLGITYKLKKEPDN